MATSDWCGEGTLRTKAGRARLLLSSSEGGRANGCGFTVERSHEAGSVFCGDEEGGHRIGLSLTVEDEGEGQ